MDPERAPATCSRSAVRRLAFSTFLFALAVRIASISTVLPEIQHPDEPINERVVLAVRADPAASPAFFSYPSFLFYSQAALLGGYEALTGTRVTPSRVIIDGVTKTEFPGHWVAARTLTAVFGSLAAALAAVLGVALGGSLRTGSVVAIWTALSPLLAEDARYMTPDTYAACFTLAALAGAFLVATSGTWKSYLFAGAMTGLAAGCKYNVALVAVAIVAAHLVRNGARGFLDPRLYLAAVASIAAFLCTTPFALLDYSHFREGLAAQARHYQRGHPGAEGNGLAYNLGILFHSEGLRLAFVPFAALSSRPASRRGSFCLASFAVVYLALLSSLQAHFGRNLVPADYPLLVLAGVGFAELGSRLEARLGHRTTLSALAVGAAILCVAPAVRITREIHRRLHNTKSGAERWIEEHVPRGSAIAVEAYGPWVDPAIYRVTGVLRYGELPERYLEQRGVRFVALAEGAYGRFFANRAKYARQVARYETLFRDHCTVAKFRDAPGAELDIVDLACRSVPLAR
jgi:hypothetical protein